MESVPLGPATRMLQIETDPRGGVYYHFVKRREQFLQLPLEHSLARLGLIDMVNTAAFLQPKSSQLLALSFFGAQGTRTLLLGDRWGQWMDDDGAIRRSEDVVETARQWHAPFTIFDKKNWLGFDFTINPHARELFSEELRHALREGNVTHSLQLLFEFPSGQFRQARLLIHQVPDGRLVHVPDLYVFPLAWPPFHRSLGEVAQHRQPHLAHPPGHATTDAAARPRPGLATHSPRPEPSGRATLPPGGSAPGAPAAPVAAPDNGPATFQDLTLNAPVPATEHLPLHVLVPFIDGEPDLDRRWRMIEANLMLARPERSYALLTHHADLVADRTCQWAPVRLKTAFAVLPAAILFGVMQGWSVNQVLAVVDDHGESERLLEWLREREIERLLHLDLNRVPASAEAARDILKVDRFADPDAIKRVWRRLLHFINADLGRSDERPIHRKKDEIAKMLQIARNVLLRAR